MRECDADNVGAGIPLWTKRSQPAAQRKSARGARARQISSSGAFWQPPRALPCACASSQSLVLPSDFGMLSLTLWAGKIRYHVDQILGRKLSKLLVNLSRPTSRGGRFLTHTCQASFSESKTIVLAGKLEEAYYSQRDSLAELATEWQSSAHAINDGLGCYTKRTSAAKAAVGRSYLKHAS